MKTSARTTLPDGTHEQPVHELKLSKWVRYLLYSAIVSWPILLGWGYFNMFEEIGQPSSNLGVEELVICVAISLLGYIISVAVMAALSGDIYFYERYVEIRRFLPFMK